MYVSILTVCRLFHISIISLYTACIKLYSPTSTPTICTCFCPYALSLCVTYYFHSWFLNSNLEPITDETVNVCTSTKTVYPIG